MVRSVETPNPTRMDCRSIAAPDYPVRPPPIPEIPLTGQLCALYVGAANGKRHPLKRDASGTFREAGFLLLALFTGNDNAEEKPMCKLCDEGIPQIHSSSRRDFLKATAATGVAAAGANLFAARPGAADDGDVPEDTGRRGRRYVIRGGSVMSLDPDLRGFSPSALRR